MTTLRDRFLAKVNIRGRIVRAELGPCWEWTANRYTNGYGQFKMNGRPRGAHRSAWILEHGEIASGIEVLHRCDNPPCVRIDHLFLGTQKDNIRDKYRKGRQAKYQNHGPRSGSTSGYKGVHWHKRSQRWHARIKVDGKQMFLGLFRSAEDAARAFDAASRSAFGPTAFQNFRMSNKETPCP